MGLFRAYDIRGIVPDELNPALAYRIAYSYATWLKRQLGRDSLNIGVARDNRESSHNISAAVAQALVDSQCTVTDFGLASTPTFYFAIHRGELDGGLQITASHNPAQYNGIKVVREGAIPVGGDTGLTEIEAGLTDTPEYPGERTVTVIPKDILSEYITAVLNQSGELPDLSTLRVLVDPGNGVSGLMAQTLFDQLSCTMLPLFFELDGSFPNRPPDPLATGNLAKTQTEVVTQQAHLGVAFDADGDRVAFIDETGAVISSDLITALVGAQIAAKQPGSKIGYDVRSSQIVPETIARAGGTPVVTRVGHAFIKSQMRAEDIAFAGELSGHFYYGAQTGYYESPLLVVLTILSLLARDPRPLSEHITPLRKYFPTGELNFTVNDKAVVMAQIRSHFANAPHVSELDGIRVEYADWWCNIRPSNTENLLRLTLEAHTPELRDTKRDEIIALITA